MSGDQKVIDCMAENWRQSGLELGDTALIHSSLKRTFRRFLREGVNISSEDVLASLLTAVGKDGTILLPLYNFGFSSGAPFNIFQTPSHMGALTECGRLHPKSVRTGHPIYSFSVIGRHSDLFRSVDNFSGYGADSPFALLKDLNGKIAVIDLPDQQSMTFYHHIEEMNDVDYRYHKAFTGEYTGYNGETEMKTYGLFVRDLEKGVLTHVDPMGEVLWNKGHYCGCRPGEGNGMRVINAQKMFDEVSEVIKQGNSEGLLYKISSESLFDD